MRPCEQSSSLSLVVLHADEDESVDDDYYFRPLTSSIPSTHPTFPVMKGGMYLEFRQPPFESCRAHPRQANSHSAGKYCPGPRSPTCVMLCVGASVPNGPNIRRVPSVSLETSDFDDANDSTLLRGLSLVSDAHLTPQSSMCETAQNLYADDPVLTGPILLCVPSDSSLSSNFNSDGGDYNPIIGLGQSDMLVHFDDDGGAGPVTYRSSSTFTSFFEENQGMNTEVKQSSKIGAIWRYITSCFSPTSLIISGQRQAHRGRLY